MSIPYEQTPVGRLHVDILHIIFWLVADDSRPQSRYKNVQTTWARLGHICTIWRAVLMDMPALWARDILAFGRRAFNDVLARTQQAPLELVYDHSVSWEIRIQLPQLIARAGLLSYRASNPQDEDILVNSLTHRSLPLLRKLSIYQITYNHPSLRGLHTPALRELSLQSIYWSPPQNGSLVSLSISGIHQGARPSLNDILDVLSHNMALKHLKLQNALDEPTAVAPRSQLGIISMPALISVELAFTNDLLLGVFSALDMPILQSLAVSIWEVVPDGEYIAIANALSVYRTAFTLPSSSKTTLAVTMSHYVMGLHLVACCEDPKSETFSFQLRPASRPRLHTIAEFLRALSDARITEHVRALTWNPDHKVTYPSEYWNIVFSSFKDVEELDIFAPISCLALPDPEGKPYLPQLIRVVANLHFRRSEIHEVSEDLKKMVHQRMRLGAPACAAWISADTEELQIRFGGMRGGVVALEKWAEENDVELTDLRSRGRRVEWRVKVDE